MTEPDYVAVAYALCGLRAPTIQPELVDALRRSYDQGVEDERKRQANVRAKARKAATAKAHKAQKARNDRASVSHRDWCRSETCLGQCWT